MKYEVLIINVTAGMDYSSVSTAPAATYTEYEHELKHGYGTLSRNDIGTRHLHLHWHHHHGFLKLDTLKILRAVSSDKYDAIHFYFEDATSVIIERNTWLPLFLAVLRRQSQKAIRSYVFTDNNDHFLLNDVYKGLNQYYPDFSSSNMTWEFNDFLDSVRQSRITHKNIHPSLTNI